MITHKVQGAWLDTWAALNEIDRLRQELRTYITAAEIAHRNTEEI